jgi:hypothetical protein
MLAPYLEPRVLEAFNGDTEKAREAYYQQASIWTCGRDVTNPSKGKIKITDAVALPNASILIPHVLTQFVKEGIEPMLIGTKLLTRIQYQPGLQIQFPALGALYAEDVAPGQSLPEFAPDLGGQATNEMRVGKSGLALKIFDDIVKYDQYNLVAYWLRLAGQALARHKESKIFNFLTSMGTVVFDNVTRGNGISGSYTSGRNRDGSLNGSMTMDDIFQMYTYGLQQGFILDTILVHPLTWLMWLRDPVLRTFQLQYGGGTWFNMWQGDPRNVNPLASFPPLGEGTGRFVNPPTSATSAPAATPVTEYSQNIDSRPTPPSYLGLSFNIIPSPFVPFSPTANTASVIMFNSNNLGALIVDEDPKVQEWKQPELDMTKMQIYEKYGIAIMNEGQAIIVANNISMKRNMVPEDHMVVQLQVSGNLVDPTASGLESPL